jgi:hypothetical protein
MRNTAHDFDLHWPLGTLADENATLIIAIMPVDVVLDRRMKKPNVHSFLLLPRARLDSS